MCRRPGTLQRMSATRQIHEMGSFRIGETGPRFRDGKTAACVLVSSGQRDKFDEPQAEFPLFECLRNQLASEGVVCFEIDFPAKVESNQLALMQRTERLRDLVASTPFLPFRNRFAIIALSFGGQITLNLLRDPRSGEWCPKFVILCSTVVDDTFVINAPVPTLSFIYGALDVVAYKDSSSKSLDFVRADEYSQFARKNLVITRNQRIETTILSQTGHLLNSKSQTPEEVARFLSNQFQLLYSHACS